MLKKHHVSRNGVLQASEQERLSRISDIASRLKAQSDSAKQSSSVINPTRFESDLVAALLKKTDISSYQSSAAMAVAQKCAENIELVSGAVKGAKVHQNKKTSDGASVLSPIYKTYMCDDGKCNGDPKSDIVISSQLNGKMRVSMKKEGDAQVASAKAGEANAVISAALGQNNEAVKAVRKVISSVLSKENYYTLRSKYGQKDFDSSLSALLGLKAGSGIPSVAQMRAVQKFLQMSGIRPAITQNITNFMASAPIRKKIFKEFASGEKRYIPSEKDRSADWFMIWNEKGNLRIWDIDEFIDSHFSAFRMNIRDRGEEGGGSLRVDIRETWELSPQQYSAFMIIEKALHQDFEYACLTEGVLDTTVSLIKSAGSAVANAYKQFISVVKAVLSMIARLFAKGIAAVLEFFGLETTEISYSW